MEYIKILTAIPVIQLLILQITASFCYILGIDKNYYLVSFFQQVTAVFIPTYYFYELRNNNPYLRKKDFSIDSKFNLLLFAVFQLSHGKNPDHAAACSLYNF